MSKTLCVLILFSALFLAGCNSVENKITNVAQKERARTSQVDTTYADGIRRITIKDFEELRRQNDAFIVDVRTQAAYDQGHIPGAKLMPSAQILNHINELPRDKTIVTYCS